LTNIFYHHFTSPIGELYLYAEKNVLIALDFSSNNKYRNNELTKTPLLQQAQIELQQYFAGSLEKFSIPIQMQGTDFQIHAWQVLQNIPYGKTISYKEQAAQIGNENAVRAIGGANGKNPIPIIIPCHRVIAHNGTLGGYSGGLDIKRKLLNLEKR
jgi:methylated-DNA-[protein]-cysteine S-methyltransferase